VPQCLASSKSGGQCLRDPRYRRRCMHLVDTQEDLELSGVNIEDDGGTSRASRFQSHKGSTAGLPSVGSSVACDVSLTVAAELAMLEPGPGQRDPRIDEVRPYVTLPSRYSITLCVV